MPGEFCLDVPRTVTVHWDKMPAGSIRLGDVTERKAKLFVTAKGLSFDFMRLGNGDICLTGRASPV
jgi:hypothetical protein